MKLKKNSVKRNKPCPCGSGKKMKNCCLRKVKHFQTQLDLGDDPRDIITATILEPDHVRRPVHGDSPL